MTSPPHVCVYLQSDRGPFTVDPAQIERLRGHFPRLCIRAVYSEEEFVACLPRAETVTTWVFKREWYGMAQRLKAVLTPAAGSEWVAGAPSGRVPIFHGTFHGYLIRESLLGAMLYFNRRMYEMAGLQREHRWDHGPLESTVLLEGQHVLFAGYGSIGRKCASLLRSFGMSMSGLQRTRKQGSDPATGVDYVTAEHLERDLARADHVVAILPADPSTDNLFGRGQFAAMQSTAYFYNYGRGNCCDQEALANACAKRHIAGAALDVFEREPLEPRSPLWDLPNVLITPHASCVYRNYLPLYFREVTGILADLYKNTVQGRTP